MTAQVLHSIRRAGVSVLAALFVFATAPMSAHSASANYEYDANGRVWKITYDDGTVVEYAYDLKGNRTGATKTSPPPDTAPPSAPGTPSFSNITMSSVVASWAAASHDPCPTPTHRTARCGDVA